MKRVVKVVAIEAKAHQLLTRWCRKKGMKLGAAASSFIRNGVNGVKKTSD